MSELNWTDVVSAVSAAATPIIVAVFGWMLTRRQSRSDLLLKARIDYYREIIPDLNRLMTYMMFIGPWRDITPLEVISLKRRLDVSFYIAAPLFSPPVTSAYEVFMKQCFVSFGQWGADALIRSSPYRRRVSWKAADPWDPDWGRLFELQEDEAVEAAALKAIRTSYDSLVSALVTDLNINRARGEYTNAHVLENAHGPLKSVEGASASPARNDKDDTPLRPS
ncbi:hypothetical protein [Arthrobacter sp. OY3WO11]|uniref:hypothetical protein n=1 Tax=Arthrobacter sp. OY3WO11 TaxID=1835723 RepID=UPI0012E7A69A|nr:hypothetical protein [Arthrobacter sp. OY3WO11]